MQKYAKQGAIYIHIVDLDGAKAGKMQQLDLIKSIQQQSMQFGTIKLQVGGGIRSIASTKSCISSGIARLVIGSIAISDPVEQVSADCDNDSLLIQVTPAGLACHLGFTTCFESEASFMPALSFLNILNNVIAKRRETNALDSYTAKLMASGVNRCAQKVGEEGTEVVIAAGSNKPTELINEASDLFFHLLVLLQVAKVNLYAVIECLQKRHKL